MRQAAVHRRQAAVHRRQARTAPAHGRLHGMVLLAASLPHLDARHSHQRRVCPQVLNRPMHDVKGQCTHDGVVHHSQLGPASGVHGWLDHANENKILPLRKRVYAIVGRVLRIMYFRYGKWRHCFHNKAAPRGTCMFAALSPAMGFMVSTVYDGDTWTVHYCSDADAHTWKQMDSMSPCRLSWMASVVRRGRSFLR